MLLAPALYGLLAGCATLPAPVAIAPTYARNDVSDTFLGRVAEGSLPLTEPQMSGFRLLPEGETAFNARIELTRRAEKSIDAQYYLIQDDEVGEQFLRELRDAAVRGVRVRLLVDDLFTAGEDPLLTGLAAYPNMEVRLFNPLPSRSSSFTWRLISSLADFNRINHRMHNKLFIADNSISVSGGRNMANEYFMRSATSNFVDLDVMSSGPVVRQQSAVFDDYWNSPYAYPVASVAYTLPPKPAQQDFDRLIQHAGARIEERQRDVLDQESVAAQLNADKLKQVIARAQVFADSPDKINGIGASSGKATVTSQTLALFASARDEVLIASPYFIPGDAGMEMMKAVGATDEDGRITLVTNSLVSTDELLVYAEYARYRLAMLRAGVRIYELGASLSKHSDRIGSFGNSLSRLHAKAAIIDGRQVFIGSMNLDPRSSLANTELGLVIDSPEIAKTVSLLSEGLFSGAYRLHLSSDGNSIDWIETEENGTQRVHHEEPGESWWVRLKIRLLSPFVSGNLL